jgi:hypothetical protein
LLTIVERQTRNAIISLRTNCTQFMRHSRIHRVFI